MSGTGPGPGGPAESAGTGQAGDLAARERARVAGAARAVRGMLAATLCLEAFTVVLVPGVVAKFGTGLTAVKLTVLVVLAVLLVAGAVGQRRRWGVVVGSVLQPAVIGCGLLTGAMYVLGAIFAAIWCYELRLRQDLLTPRLPPP